MSSLCNLKYFVQLQAETEEARDSFNIEITITNPMKVGDGMSAYMVYQVNTVVSVL